MTDTPAPDAVTEAVRAWEVARDQWCERHGTPTHTISAAATAIAALSADRERLQAALREAEVERDGLFRDCERMTRRICDVLAYCAEPSEISSGYGYRHNRKVEADRAAIAALARGEGG